MPALRFPFLHICSLVVLPLLFAACSADQEQNEILVFAAASLRESMEELGATFEAETGTHVLFNFAGSNDLAQQIIAAPRADVYLSASENWMDSIEKAGKVANGMRRDILSNSLVLIAHKESTTTFDDPCNLVALPFKNLAIGDPESVPAGTYAREWLSSVMCAESSLWEHVQDRVVPTPNVRAALGLVLAGPEILGIVYSTDQIVFTDQTTILYEVTGGPQIRYLVARIADAPSPAAADQFYHYLARPKAKEIFQRYGFTFLSPKP